MRARRSKNWMLATAVAALVGCGSRDEAPEAPAIRMPVVPSPAPGTAPGAPAPGTASSVRTASSVAATGCPATDGTNFVLPGTVHNDGIDGTETWTLAGSPHRFPDGANLHENAVVTIEPCARIIVGDGRAIRVEQGATLIARGDATHPILFESASVTPARGVWAGIEFQSNARAASALHSVVLEDAGGDAGMAAALAIRDGFALDAQHVRIVRSKLHGVYVEGRGRFAPGSVDLTVTESGSSDTLTSPVYFQTANSVGSLPEGRYDGNVVNDIVVEIPEVTSSTTFRNPGAGVRYRFLQGLLVEGDAGPVLTVAPGTTLAFAPETTFWVGRGADGAVMLDGTAEASRIVLTSARPTPDAGDWGGLFLGEHLARAATKLAFVDVAYAGRTDGSDDVGCGDGSGAAITIAGRDLGAHVDHVRVVSLDPAAVGIGRGFNATTPATDYTVASLGNDLGGGGRCKQTLPRDAEGNCPDPVPACR